MKEVAGTYFDGKSSRAHSATLRITGSRLEIEGEGGTSLLSARLSECSLAYPLGNTSRALRLPGGGIFEAPGETMQNLENSLRYNTLMRTVHSLESHWKTVAISFLGIFFFIWLFHTYAIPVLAKKLAFSLPAGINIEISSHTMDILDSHFFKPTLLAHSRTGGIRRRFQALLSDLGPDVFTYRLEFRESRAIGPNAFALPSGTVVMTDELVNLSKDDRELDGILLHEIGHVRERHALRTLIQNAGVFLVISALAGDLSGISSAAASLPAVLVHSEYSRTFEREADRFAAGYFFRKGLPVKPLQDILRRLGGKAGRFPGESVLSSHPAIEERIADLETYGQGKH